MLDAECRADGRSLASVLGATVDRVPSGVAVGMFSSTGALLDAVAAYVDQGYHRVKLKVEPGHDVVPVAAVRDAYPSLALQVDANGSYDVHDLDHLRQFDAFGLVLLEQPLADDDFDGHAFLGRHLATPICLDESITSARVAEHAIAMGACRVVNIKAGRVGGYLEAVRIHDVCVRTNTPAWCGGMLESGIGRAANIALAALPGFTLPGDLSASARYFHRDVTDAFTLDDGFLHVPSGPGIGVVPIIDRLREFTVGTTTIPLTD
jgi:o-succinylbenzoate synthase